MKFTTTVEADLTVEQLADLFAGLDDDSQAKFFCIAAKNREWMNAQAWFIGRHLATCTCSTQDGRDFIEEIHKEMTKPRRDELRETLAILEVK